ncbi:SDR family NAD(P)-dependent oxidoreductase [Burkholderia ubonensis]|uniref:SDR family NAD(P)-dependent oxidoreductase n=1 Tax=Burkholderia ubonensis TaxID=101571 RepID=UPI0009B4D7F9|nr:SDR family NAD(P)-dependent oxidoreductase [Burkholderia ubonensis]
MHRLSEMDVCDLEGKVAVVTGLDGQLGWRIARELSDRNAKVILAYRDADKVPFAADKDLMKNVTRNIHLISLDVAKRSSITRFAEMLYAEVPWIDFLVNGVDVVPKSLNRTEGGFEESFWINHLGIFMLTGRLLGNIKVGGRVICISGHAHRHSKGIDFLDPNWEMRSYDPWRAYCDSKLANLLFILELARRLNRQGVAVSAVSVPADCISTYPRYLIWSMKNSRLGSYFRRIARALFERMAGLDALLQLDTVISSRVRSVDYIVRGGHFDILEHPSRVNCVPTALDLRSARQLWSLSEQLTGVRFLSK